MSLNLGFTSVIESLVEHVVLYTTLSTARRDMARASVRRNSKYQDQYQHGYQMPNIQGSTPSTQSRTSVIMCSFKFCKPDYDTFACGPYLIGRHVLEEQQRSILKLLTSVHVVACEGKNGGNENVWAGGGLADRTGQ